VRDDEHVAGDQLARQPRGDQRAEVVTAGDLGQPFECRGG
jgi:hypothetical protein